MNTIDDQLEARRRACAPRVDVVDAGHQSVALAREVVQVSRRGRALRLSARRRRIVAVAAALVIVPGTAVAAGQFAARTGVFGHPGKTEEDTSE